jgi:DNA-binding response OmpR family regulator
MSDRLLVVDDDDAIRQTFRSFFEAAAFEVDTASTLSEAADRLAASKYSAVIVDICLTERGTEGLAIAAYVRQIWQDLTVVILTAYGSPQRAAAAARLDVDAFLHKPVSLVWLEAFLRARITARRAELAAGDPASPVAATAS